MGCRGSGQAAGQLLNVRAAHKAGEPPRGNAGRALKQPRQAARHRAGRIGVLAQVHCLEHGAGVGVFREEAPETRFQCVPHVAARLDFVFGFLASIPFNMRVNLYISVGLKGLSSRKTFTSFTVFS